MTYQIAIPSYHRPARLAAATLKLLAGTGTDMSRVTVFLADDQEVDAYQAVTDSYGVNVRSGHGVGLSSARNHISASYPTGTNLMQMDDDLSDIRRWVDSKNTEPITDMPALIEEGFLAAQETLWGIYASLNPYFMGPRVRQGLWFIQGCFFGYRVQNREHEKIVTDHGEDYERSLRFFERHGAVTRLDKYAPKTRYFTEPGGMQDTRTPEDIATGLAYVEQKWPHLVRRHTDAKGRDNLRLKNIKS